LIPYIKRVNREIKNWNGRIDRKWNYLLIIKSLN
jgi:hypothetical protein